MTKATRKDDSTTSNIVQGIQFKEYPDQSYSSQDTQKLLDLVFHGLEEDEHIATFYTKNGQPSYPVTTGKTLNKIDRTAIPHAFYYGTSSLHTDTDGKVYNRKSQFAGLHVVVLDDIGTKIDVDSLPEELVPNYIIESSKGNYQYGYVLAEPIRDIALADALIHLVYTSGFSDSGGKLATKAVRLPAGVNGKKGTDKFLDPVTLVSSNEDYWTPEDLINVLDMGITWEQVLEDPSKVTQTKTRELRSLSPWAAVPIVAEAQSGVVDSMLEYLYSEGMVVHDNGAEWMTIKCPWHEGHTSGADTAGYSPLGRGGVEFQNQRGFKCLHEHCAGHNTADFLQHMAIQGSEELPVYDEAAFLVRDYVYDEISDCVIRVANAVAPYAIPMKGFRNSNNQKTVIYTAEGKAKRVTLAAIWETARHRVCVSGNSYNPACPTTIVTDVHGTKKLNTFVEPPWGDGKYDQKDVDMFLDIAHYLMPVEEEFNYFMQWLAAKVCERNFKGNAILMVATTQGIGRTMFSDLITDMFTRSNCGKVTFPELIAEGGFNEWQSNMLVFCDEVMTDRKKLYSSYETLKDRLDPRPKEILINKKFGSKSPEMNYSSFLLLTNHAAAIGALRGDRRIYIISNPQVRKEPEYYTAIEAWRNKLDSSGKPAWIKNVWRWLRQQPYNIEMLSKPVPDTRGKVIMQEETDGIEETLIRWCFKNIAPCLPSKVIRDLIIEANDMAGANSDEVLGHFKQAMKFMTLNAKGFKETQRVNGTAMKFRVSTEAVAAGKAPALTVPNRLAVNASIVKSAEVLNKVYYDKPMHLKIVTELAEIINSVV